MTVGGVGRSASVLLALACHVSPSPPPSPAPPPVEAPPVAPPGPVRLEGIYVQGFETEAFRPCDEEVSWWVTGTEVLHERYRAVAARPYEPVRVVLRGIVGDEGRYGHMGAYLRELQVVDVLDVRVPEPGECGYRPEAKSPPP